MSRYMDLDVVVPLVKNIAENEKDTDRREFFNAIGVFLDECPYTYMDKLVVCADCWYYNTDNKRCAHNRGLSGKLSPNWHCPFGSETNYGADDQEPELDFSMFDFDKSEQ